jgi:hypothetical protein
MLPKNLKYSNKIESANARSYVSNIQPQGSTNGYSSGTTVIINIPTRNNLVLCSTESILKFKVSLTGNGQGRLDSCGAHSFVQRIRVFSGSNLCEDCDNYGMMVKQLFDLQVPEGTISGKSSVLQGTRADRVLENSFLALAAGTDPATTQALANSMRNYLINPGKRVNTMNTGELISTDNSRTYCLSLVSILGTLSSSNYFPLFGATSSPIRLEIQLVDSVHKAMCCSNNITDFTFDNVEYIASYIELSDNATRAVVSNLTNSLQYSLPNFRNFQYTFSLAAGVNTQVNFPIAAKYVSLKSLIISMRDVAKGVNTPLYYPYSSHTFGLQSYFFRMGSLTMPAIQPSTVPQFFSEVIKTVGSISDMHNTPSIDLLQYNMPIPVINNQINITQGDINSGGFCVGIDLENYPSSEKSQTYSGYNSSNDDIYLVMNFLNPTANAINVRFDAFAMYDQEVVFENQTAYVKF